MTMDRLPPGHIIRPMQLNDLAGVLAIESASQSHPWTERQFVQELENSASSIDLYCCQNGPIGYICSWLIAGELQIQNLAVANEFRRHGIAARLLRLIISRSSKYELDSAWLEVGVGNRAAVALYEKIGFSIVGRRSGYYHDGEDAYMMSYQPSQQHTPSRTDQES
jgi:ribosomal-protein-alanine N-acetyltransferase